MKRSGLLGVALALQLSGAAGQITPVEDRPGLFRSRSVPTLESRGFGQIASVRWQTDHELLVSADRRGDWEARGAWDTRSFRWNIDTGAIAETPYVGRVICVSPKRLVLRRDTHYYAAELWSAAVPIGSESGYNAYSCEPMPRTAGKSGPGTNLVPLLPGDGSVLYEIRPPDQNATFLAENGGKRVAIGRGMQGGSGELISNLAETGPAYLPWKRQYLFGGFTGDHRIERMWTYDITLHLVSPDGGLEALPEPAPINQWKKSARLAVSFVATRGGIVWRVAHPRRGTASEFDGLYVERRGALVRFLRHAELGQRSVAPGGCRALVQVDPTGRNFPHGGVPETVLIDFCEES